MILTAMDEFYTPSIEYEYQFYQFEYRWMTI